MSADTHLPSSSETSNTGLKALGKMGLYVLWWLILKTDSGLNKLHTKMQNGNNLRKDCDGLWADLLTQESQPKNKALYSVCKLSLSAKSAFLPALNPADVSSP